MNDNYFENSSKRKKRFIKNYQELSPEQIDIEKMWTQEMVYEKLEKIRSNLSSIVWIIVVGIILSILAMFF